MTSAAMPWPPALAGTPAVEVIERAIGRGRLSHSLLLAGDDPEGLSAAALAMADRLLNRGSTGPSPYAADRHPDCFQVRPAGKSRGIGADAMRDLVGRINVAASISQHKVVIIHDAERMNAVAANILLKTLEEPPANTTILLLTGRPHALLPTIRSRVLHFRFPGMASEVRAEGWGYWLADYRAWLQRLGQRVAVAPRGGAPQPPASDARSPDAPRTPPESASPPPRSRSGNPAATTPHGRGRCRPGRGRPGSHSPGRT